MWPRSKRLVANILLIILAIILYITYFDNIISSTILLAPIRLKGIKVKAIYNEIVITDIFYFDKPTQYAEIFHKFFKKVWSKYIEDLNSKDIFDFGVCFKNEDNFDNKVYSYHENLTKNIRDELFKTILKDINNVFEYDQERDIDLGENIIRKIVTDKFLYAKFDIVIKKDFSKKNHT